MRVRGPKSGFRRTISLRRNLRREMTPAERLFWSKVASRQFYNLKFRKQQGIGPYIADFSCPEKKTIVEIDGDSHAGEQNEKNDKNRTEYLESFGYKVIRYQNADVLNNIDGVFEDLLRKLNLL